MDLSTEQLKVVLEKWSNNEREKDLFCASIASVVSSLIIDMILSFKHEAFEEEKEWRLIRVTLDDESPERIKFRGNENDLIPYLSSAIIERRPEEPEEDIFLALSSLYFGPSLEKKRTTSALRLYLQSQARNNSNIKLRNPRMITVNGMAYTLRE